MSCNPEQVTGFVDGALDAPAAEAVQGHLSACAVCRGQAAAERSLRARLLELEAPWPGEALRGRIRAALAAEPHPLDEPSIPAPWLLALAAGAGLIGALTLRAQVRTH